MRRVACIALPQLRVEIARGRERLPLGVVVSRQGGSVKTERDVLGNTRLDVVSPEARAVGVRAGQTVAAARAKCADLRVRVVGESAVHVALVRVAESMLAFGPVVAFGAEEDVVWVEVGGCAHLHGSEDDLARAMVTRVCAQGHACRVAIAGGPRIAAAVARFAPRGKASAGGPFIVPSGKGAAAMSGLPVRALGLDDDVQSWLSDLGLRTCGDLQKLPRRALGTRLGARAHDVFQRLDGEDNTPLDAWRPAETPEERIELEWGAQSIEALAFVTSTLCERLAARLEGRAMAAARVEIVLGLDRALCNGALPESVLAVVLPAPIARGKELFAVVRARLERHTLAAPVLMVALRALELVPAPARTRDLLSPEPRAERALPPLVAELAAEFGHERVGTLALVDTWAIDERSRLIRVPLSRSGSMRGAGPLLPKPPIRKISSLVTSALEPTRVVPPVRVPHGALVDPVLLSRVEDVEWWRRSMGRRDVVAAWFSGALAWLEMDDSAHVQLRGWVD
jgi:protein ImuB